jgi:hypothetical protein
MSTPDAADAAEDGGLVDHVAVKLPLFWKSSPKMWFNQAESQFHIKGITVSLTKYHHVVARIPEDVALKVANVINAISASGSSTPYEDLKKRLMAAYTPGPYEMLDNLIHHPTLGDRRPSDMMDEMLALLPKDEKAGMLFNAHFLGRLPAEVKSALVSAKFESSLDLAAEADKHWDALRSRSIASATLAAVEVPVCASPPPRSSRVSSPRRERPRGRSSARASDGSTQCFYHRQFGADARRCNTPCSWSGNGSGGGNRRRRN